MPAVALLPPRISQSASHTVEAVAWMPGPPPTPDMTGGSEPPVIVQFENCAVEDCTITAALKLEIPIAGPLVNVHCEAVTCDEAVTNSGAPMPCSVQCRITAVA